MKVIVRVVSIEDGTVLDQYFVETTSWANVSSEGELTNKIIDELEKASEFNLFPVEK